LKIKLNKIVKNLKNNKIQILVKVYFLKKAYNLLKTEVLYKYQNQGLHKIHL